jgi:hypothetical protein
MPEFPRFALQAAGMCLAVLTCPSAWADFKPVSGFGGQLFPSYIISTASVKVDPSEIPANRLGDPRGLLGVQVVSPKANTPVTVIVECKEFLETSTFSGKLASKGETYTITPKIKYNYDRLAKCDQATPASVTYRVKLGDSEEEETHTCMVRSINDCPFAYQDGDQVIDISYTFAAYVNEQHPFVDKLLREALDEGVVKRFTGYQSGKPEEVILQAYALWDILVARDIRYSSITATAVESDAVASQHVRLIEDSVNNSQANCVDGSVLLVSMLRKIGIDAFLVITPDHCYAGFYTDPKRENCFGLETTLLGEAVDLEDGDLPELFSEAIEGDLRGEQSFSSFIVATKVATIALAKAVQTSDANQTAVAADEDGEVRDAEEVKIIDIAQARKEGILPIGFQNKEGFVYRAPVAADTEKTATAERTSTGATGLIVVTEETVLVDDGDSDVMVEEVELIEVDDDE